MPFAGRRGSNPLSDTDLPAETQEPRSLCPPAVSGFQPTGLITQGVKPDHNGDGVACYKDLSNGRRVLIDNNAP